MNFAATTRGKKAVCVFSCVCIFLVFTATVGCSSKKDSDRNAPAEAEGGSPDRAGSPTSSEGGTRPQSANDIASEAINALPPGEPMFRDVSEDVGLDFQHTAGPIGDYFFPEIMCAGGALLDFDQDGDLDIYLINGNETASRDARPSQSIRDDGGDAPPVVNQLYRQEPDGSFVNVTESSGLGDPGYGMGVAVGDINNDGYPDVYVTNYGPDRLFVNNGDGSFRDATQEAGIDNQRWAASAVFCDYDRDGWLDLYVTNYVNYFPDRQCKSANGMFDYCSPGVFDNTLDKLYRNASGDKAQSGDEPIEILFTDVSVEAGISSKRGPGLGVTARDFNLDGWVDLYVANDGAANFLWINQQDGTFVDEASLRGIALDGQGRAQAGMGIAVTDLGHDGRPDVLVTHLGGESNAFYQNDDGALFQDVAVARGLGVASYAVTGFGTAFVDLDHDGYRDLLVVNGRVTRPPRVASTDPANEDSAYDDAAFWSVYAERNQVFRNDGSDEFRPVDLESEPFCAASEVSRALCCGDIDGDGDVDVLVVNIGGPARLFLNEAASEGHWLQVKLTDPERGGRDLYGARVTVHADSRQWTQELQPGSSYLSSHAPILHFGLGEVASLSSIKVDWPDGMSEEFPASEVDQTVELSPSQEGRE